MGVFEFIIVLVTVTTIGKVVTDRQELAALAKNRQAEPGPDYQALVETVDDMNTRLARVEEERDFYRKLLEAPEVKDRLTGPQSIDTESSSE